MINQKGRGFSKSRMMKLEMQVVDDHERIQVEHYRNIIRDLKKYYGLLCEELNKPVSNKVIDFAKRTGSSKAKYGLILCKPVPEENNRYGSAYLAELVFIANGVRGKKRLDDFDLDSVPAHHIAVRAMTDPGCENTILFLHSSAADDYLNWILNLPGTVEEICFSSAGFTKIPVSEIEKLDGRLFYFGMSSDRPTSKSYIERIRNAIQL